MADMIPAQFTSADGRRLSPLAYLFLVMLCFGYFTPGLATMPPTDRDESSFAQATKQMIETGNYVDIRLQDKPRYQKPIGIYWLQAASVKLLNPHHLDEIWAYRIPSFLGATIAVLFTAALGALLFSPGAGLLGAMMLAGSVLLNVEARLATSDGALLACVMGTMWALGHAYKKNISGWRVPLVFWTAIAFGILLKGPIVLLPVLSALLWLRLADKNIGWFKNLRPLPGILYALILVAPWFVAILTQSHGAFLQQSAGHDMLAKLWQGQNRGIVPPGMHLLALPIAFFPFVIFILFAAPDAWKARRDTAVKFCLGWLIPTWILFELALTKLPHYVLPTYPALALLAGKFMLDGFPTVATTARRLPIVLVIMVWFAVGCGYAFLFSVLPAFSDHIWMPWQMAAGAALIVAQAATLLALPRRAH